MHESNVAIEVDVKNAAIINQITIPTMEAKFLCIKKRGPVIRVVSAPRIQWTRLQHRVGHQFSRFCTMLWNVLKARDPWLDQFLHCGGKHREEGEKRVDLGTRFAAIIPGNSTAEYVITSGFLNFL